MTTTMTTTETATETIAADYEIPQIRVEEDSGSYRLQYDDQSPCVEVWRGETLVYDQEVWPTDDGNNYTNDESDLPDDYGTWQDAPQYAVAKQECLEALEAAKLKAWSTWLAEGSYQVYVQSEVRGNTYCGTTMIIAGPDGVIPDDAELYPISHDLAAYRLIGWALQGHNEDGYYSTVWPADAAGYLAGEEEED